MLVEAKWQISDKKSEDGGFISMCLISLQATYCC